MYSQSIRFRYRQTVGAQPLEMKLGCCKNVGEDLIQRLTGCDASRKVGTYAEKFSGPLSITTA